MNRSELEQKVESQGFDEGLFWEAAHYIFQQEYKVTQWNEPATATREQIDWALAYSAKYDGFENETGDRFWIQDIAAENMWQNARGCGANI